MKDLINKTKVFLADEQGAETVEWVMIAAVLAVIIGTAFWVTLKGSVNNAIGRISNCMNATSNASCL
jgi:Flp pilus assembly pilin Flp